MTREQRVGLGYDSHRFVSGRPLIIGGVTIPHDQGLYGHSDADVLLHAVIDALLGAAALGDIGEHFPDTAAEFKDVDSKVLLKHTLELIGRAGWEIVNCDTTLILEKPKLKEFKPAIRQSLAELLALPLDAVNVKAKTAEKMGALGRAEGIVAQAVVLIAR